MGGVHVPRLFGIVDVPTCARREVEPSAAWCAAVDAVVGHDVALVWRDRRPRAGVDPELQRLAHVAQAARVSAVFALNGPELVPPGTGIHHAAPALAAPPARHATLEGVSTHDADELARAAERFDYAFVSPVWSPRSKADRRPPLGIDGLRTLLAATDVPVIALGGLDPQRAALAIDAGAHGVGTLSAFSRMPDVGELRDYFAALNDTTSPD